MMRYTIMLEVLEWAARNFGKEAVDALISKAREWAQDDGVEDWDDWLVDILELVADYLLKKYQ
jgi:hypothetical protein